MHLSCHPWIVRVTLALHGWCLYKVRFLGGTEKKGSIFDTVHTYKREAFVFRITYLTIDFPRTNLYHPNLMHYRKLEPFNHFSYYLYGTVLVNFQKIKGDWRIIMGKNTKKFPSKIYDRKEVRTKRSFWFIFIVGIFFPLPSPSRIFLSFSVGFSWHTKSGYKLGRLIPLL